MSVRKYQLAALVGTVIMGVGAFMACLCAAPSLILTGNILLGVSILVMIYGYSGWQQ